MLSLTDQGRILCIMHVCGVMEKGGFEEVRLIRRFGMFWMVLNRL